MRTSSSEWIGIEQLAEEIGVPVRTVYAWRTKGGGPRGAVFGKHIRFRRKDVDSWIEAQYPAPRPAA